MKKFKYLLFSIFLAVLCVACSNDEYKMLIPKNAKAVVAVNLKQLFDGYELPESAKSKIYNLLKLFVSGSDSDLLIDLIEGNEDSGIDFNEPFYIFKAPDSFWGASLKVDDIDDLDELFSLMYRQNLCNKPVEKDDYKWTDILDDISAVYNEDVLSLMFSNSISDTKKKQNALLNNDEEDTFFATEKFSKMDDMEGPLKFLFSADAFVNYNDKDFKNVIDNLHALLPEGVRPVDVCVVGDLSTGKGIVNVDYELFSTNKKTQMLLEKEDNKYKKIKGDFIGAPNDFACWLALGVKGEDFVRKLKQFNTIDQYIIKLERAIDIENILQSISGDVALLLPNNFENDELSAFVLSANLNNTDFLKSVDLWMNQMVDFNATMDEVAKNSYVLKADSMQLNWGVDNKNIYFATGNSFFKSAFAEKSDKLNEVEEDIRNSVFFVYINVEGINEKLEEKFDLYKKLNFLEYITLKASDYRNYHLTFVLKEKEKNIWQILSDQI